MYRGAKKAWRNSVMEYYCLPSADDAKSLLLAATNGMLSKRRRLAEDGDLPFVVALAVECARIRREVCKRYPDVVADRFALGKSSRKLPHSA